MPNPIANIDATICGRLRKLQLVNDPDSSLYTFAVQLEFLIRAELSLHWGLFPNCLILGVPFYFFPAILWRYCN